MIQFQDTKPIYLQIVDSISTSILDNIYPEGERIPSVRELSEQLGVNPNTCARSFESLTRDGIIEARRGMGYWVAAQAKKKISKQLERDFFDNIMPHFKRQMQVLGIPTEVVIKYLIED